MARREEVVIVNPREWEELSMRLRFRSGPAAKLAMDVMRDEILTFGVEEAHRQLDVMIYDAPLPTSAAGREAWYEANRRQGYLRDAIQKEESHVAGSATAGRIYVDEDIILSNPFQTGRRYFYALSVEYGVASMDYAARPFWQATEIAMDIEFGPVAEAASLRFVTEIMR